MKQQVFPFQIPDRTILEILSEVHKLNESSPAVQDWFQSIMVLLDTRADVNFGDLVIFSPSRNGNLPDASVFSYQRGCFSSHSVFPNLFLQESFKHCVNKPLSGLIEIQPKACMDEISLPYCPVVVSLGYHDHRFGFLAVGSYCDKAIVSRNSKMFQALGNEMSFYLYITHLRQMISSFLFEKEEGILSFEDLLSFKFQQLIDKIDPTVGGNIMGEVIMLVEKILIRLALEKTNHKLGHAATLLGINRNTLRKKIHAFGLETQEVQSCSGAR